MPILADRGACAIGSSSDVTIRVLNVNDDPAARYVISRMFRAGEFVVHEAGTAAEAVTAIECASPDVVVLDVKLPDEDGRMVCRRIKESSGSIPLPVILLSAVHVADADRVAGFESGADMYLAAPVDAAVLIAAVRALVRARRAQVELFSRAQAARAEAEEARRVLDALMRHIPEGITIADAPDVRIRMVSRFGQDLTGRPAEELVGIPAEVHPSAWGIYHSDGVTPATPDELPLTRAVRRGETVTDEEWLLHRGDGRDLILLCNAGPIRSTEGAIVGGVIAWRDITVRKELEARNDALLLREQAAREQAEAANRAKDSLIGVIGHELRNPLAALAGAFTVLQRVGDRAAEAEKAREIIGRQLKQMAALVEDLVNFGRVSSGTLRLDSRPLDLGKVALQSVEALKAAGKLDDREVRVSVKSVIVNGDSRRLDQVIANLVGNAVKFTLPGGMINISVAPSDEGAMLRIADDGQGITPDLLPRIFDPFFSTDGMDAPTHGLGIGLAIVRQLVEAHGGRIEAESAGRGRGAAFTVRLPILAPM